MTFGEKLKALRTKAALTQEELAESLYVSRTAVSKWESGRGYPNIDSLKAIALVLGVTIDELLSSDELLVIAETDHEQERQRFCDLVFGLLDVSALLFLILPLFGQTVNGIIQDVSLLDLSEISVWLRVTYFVAVISMLVWGIFILVLHNRQKAGWRYKGRISLTVNAAGLLLFIMSSQPYAATVLFLFLTIKVLLLIRNVSHR